VEIEAVAARVTESTPRRRQRQQSADAPHWRTAAPARSPSARRPCTEAVAMPASTGASSRHGSAELPSPRSSSTPRRASSRWMPRGATPRFPWKSTRSGRRLLGDRCRCGILGGARRSQNLRRRARQPATVADTIRCLSLRPARHRASGASDGPARRCGHEHPRVFHAARHHVPSERRHRERVVLIGGHRHRPRGACGLDPLVKARTAYLSVPPTSSSYREAQERAQR
jgi:hypothetical protein